jgi:hypothetical protein
LIEHDLFGKAAPHFFGSCFKLRRTTRSLDRRSFAKAASARMTIVTNEDIPSHGAVHAH